MSIDLKRAAREQGVILAQGALQSTNCRVAEPLLEALVLFCFKNDFIYEGNVT